MAPRSRSLCSAVLVATLSCSGCNNLPQPLQKFADQLKKEWQSIVDLRLEKILGFSGEYKRAPADAHTQANAETLQEMNRVIYLNDAPSGNDFSGFLNVLNQGASFEGLYNGFTHSAAYRRLEESGYTATPAAVTVFSEELLALQADLKTPGVFDESSARPLARPVMPGSDEAPKARRKKDPAEVEVIEFGQKPTPTPEPTSEAPSLGRYQKLFAQASIFTLKRVLADEVLRLIDEKGRDRQALASWYGKWAARLAGRKVDFGLALRNRSDEQFHKGWALSATEDRIRWECLNRLHRVLNDAFQAR